MGRKSPDPGKKRTREHVIAAQSTNHVERFVVDCGFTAERVANDYGYDLIMFTFDANGFVEEGQVYLQLKATDSLPVTRRGISFAIDTKDYRLWTKEPMPVFLVVYDAVGRKGYWLYVQNYFESNRSRRPKAGAKTVRVVIPPANVVDEAFVRYAQARKLDVLGQLSRVIVHHG